MQYDFELVGKIGSMALIRQEEPTSTTTSSPAWDAS